MSDNLKVATICGVRVSGLFLMKAKTPGVCGQTNKNYPAGELILNKWGSKLTPAERSGLFGTGRTCDITVLWDAVKNIPVEDEDSDYSNEEMDLLAENQRRYTEQQAARQVEQRAQRKKSDFKPSSYQETIKEALLTTGKNLLIAALAGCGKTSTLVWLIWALFNLGFLKGKTVFFLAYNANIRDDITPELKGSGVPALTSHQFCLRHVLGYDIKQKEKERGAKNRRLFLRVIVDKLNRVYDEHAEEAAMNSGFWKFRSRCLNMVEKVKNWAICPTFSGTGWVFSDDQREQIKALMRKYRIEVFNVHEEKTLVDLICGVISYGIPAPGIEPGEYDFDDMLYLPLVLDLPMPKVHLVFVDEVQDWNAAQIRILAKLEDAGCRIVAVGDRNQAIYAFRGADSRAWDRLQTVLEKSRRGMTLCDLPVNYRCAEVIIEYAQEIVPALQGFKKVRGIRDHGMAYAGMLEMFKDQPVRFIEDEGFDRPITYAILCRSRAPLIHAAYDIILKGLPVCILGKGDLTRPLLDILDRTCGRHNARERCNRISDLREDRSGRVITEGFLTRLDEYVRVEKAKYEGKEEFAEKLSDLSDNAEALKVIASNVQDDTVDSLRLEIDNLFVDKPTPGAVTLTTVHGAKGLEWDVVCIIRKDLLPHPSVKKYDREGNITDEYQQEINCDYIARTRAKYEVYVIADWPYDNEKAEARGRQATDQPGYDNFWGMEGGQNSGITDDVFDVRSAPIPAVIPNSYQFVNRGEESWEDEADRRGVFGPTTRRPEPAFAGQRAAVKPAKRKFVDNGKPF